MSDRDTKADSTDAAVEELDKLKDAIAAAHRDRVRKEQEFESFVRSFREPPPVRRSIERPPPAPAPVVIAPPVQTPVVPEIPPKRKRRGAAPIGIAAAAILVAIWWWWPGGDLQAPGTGNVTSSPSSPPVAPNDSGAERSTSPPAPSSEPSPQPSTPAAQVTNPPAHPTPSPAQTTAPVPQPSTTAQPASAPVIAEITTTRLVWMRVTADDERLFEREVPAGERIPLRANRRIILRAGDGGAVRLTVNGRDEGLLGEDGKVVTRTLVPQK